MKDVSESDIKNNLKLVSKRKGKDKTIIKIKGFEIGGNKITVMAGPCRVENEKQIMEIAKFVKERGCSILRGGAYKPCTFPYASTGMGEKGLELLKKAGDKYGLIVVSEVMDIRLVNKVAEHVDILQIGARNMQNYNLLEEVGKTKKPVLLKRHPGASLRDFLGAAEWLMYSGSEKVILCERGVAVPYTHDKDARWAVDLTIIPAIKKYTHLPIVIDPSHGGGTRDFVPALSRASIAAGADGLIIEIHPNPDKSESDPLQTIDFNTFSRLMGELRKIAKAIGKEV